MVVSANPYDFPQRHHPHGKIDRTKIAIVNNNFYLGWCPKCGTITCAQHPFDWVHKTCSKCVETTRVSEWNFVICNFRDLHGERTFIRENSVK